MIFIFIWIIFSCENNEKEIGVIDIVYIGGDIKYFISENKFYLPKIYKNVGVHKLNLTRKERLRINEMIVRKKIYALPSNLVFIKKCKSVCLSQLIIRYKNNKKQHFTFENYNYRDNFDDENYLKISNLEEFISTIILSKKLNYQTKIDIID